MIKKLISVMISLIISFSVLTTQSYCSFDRDEEETVSVIVEVKGNSVLQTLSAAKSGDMLISQTSEAKKAEKSVCSAQTKVLSEIRACVDESAAVKYTYTYVYNGFSIDIRKQDIDKIKALPGVENIYPVKTYQIAEKDSEEDYYINNCGEMIYAGYMHDLGYTGKGTVIAVIDNFFDAEHENFKGSISDPKYSFEDIKEKIANYNLNINSLGANATATRVYRSEKIPFAFNYSFKNSDTLQITHSHGTHVAGIAAGNNGTDPLGGKFLGVAPDAQLFLMACGVDDKGAISDESIIAAIDDSVKLGADVINLSLGILNESNNPTTTAVSNARNAGIVISAAAGNKARGYDYNEPLSQNIDYSELGSPAIVPASTAVASAENTRIWNTGNMMIVGDRNIIYHNVNKNNLFSSVLGDNEYDYVYIDENYSNESLNNKIAVVYADNTTCSEYCRGAKNSGAAGIILIVSMEVSNELYNEIICYDIPVSAIDSDSGELLINHPLKKVYIYKDIQACQEDKETEINDFSSWGVPYNLDLKPELTAPGGNIFSSYSNGEYGNMSGTSMATPAYSGASALMLQYIKEHPEKYADEADISIPELVENLMMSSADVLIRDSDSNIPYSPRSQGAGLINLKKASETPVILLGDTYEIGENVIKKSKISLGEISPEGNGIFELSFKARNLTNVPVNYDKIYMTVITDLADENGRVSDSKKLFFSSTLPASVAIPADGEQTINAAVTLDKDELAANAITFTNGFFIDGYVYLENSEDDSIPCISIPFSGFYGDWFAAPVLDNNIFDDPEIGKSYLYYMSTVKTDGSPSSESEIKIAGYNAFVSDDCEDFKDYVSEDYVGFSPDENDEGDMPLCVVTPFRTMGETSFAICDGKGKEIIRKTDVNRDTGDPYICTKFTSTYLYFDKSVINALPDGDYSFKVYTGFIGRTPYIQNESLEMKFYIDREKPSITGYEKSADGNTLTVRASDNRYLMGFVVNGLKNGEEYNASYPVKGLAECEKEIDISGIDEGTLSVTAYDYAMNSTALGENGLDITFSQAFGTSRIYNLNNTTGEVINASLVLALYSNGALADVVIKDISIPTGDSVEVFNVKKVAFDSSKIFVLEGRNTLKPLFSCFSF